MGVMSCQRPDCDNIMCDRIVMGAYLCDSCHAEFLEWRQTWPGETTAANMRERIEQFLVAPSGVYKVPAVLSRDEIDAEIEKIFDES